MFASLIILLLGFLQFNSCVAIDGSEFEASPSVSSNISYILSTADKTISTNSSHDVAATFQMGINDTRYASVYTNWPVRSLQLYHAEN